VGYVEIYTRINDVPYHNQNGCDLWLGKHVEIVSSRSYETRMRICSYVLHLHKHMTRYGENGYVKSSKC